MTPAEADVMLGLTYELASARAQRDGFRAVAHAAVQKLAAVTREADRLRDRYHHLLDQCRAERQRSAA